MKQEKIYVGSGRKSGNYAIVNISVCLSDLPKEHMFEYNGKKYIKLTVAAKREVDQFGKSHYVAVDTFKPESKTTGEPIVDNSQSSIDPGDVPF